MAGKIVKKTDARFEEFWERLTDELNGLKSVANPIIKECLYEVFPELLNKTRGKAGGAGGKKPINGWNGFMAEKMQEVKEDESIDASDR